MVIGEAREGQQGAACRVHMPLSVICGSLHSRYALAEAHGTWSGQQWPGESGYCLQEGVNSQKVTVKVQSRGQNPAVAGGRPFLNQQVLKIHFAALLLPCGTHWHHRAGTDMSGLRQRRR